MDICLLCDASVKFYGRLEAPMVFRCCLGAAVAWPQQGTVRQYTKASQGVCCGSLSLPCMWDNHMFLTRKPAICLFWLLLDWT